MRLLRRLSGDVEELSKKECIQLHKDWWNAYSTPFDAASPPGFSHQFLWHVFSYGQVPSSYPDNKTLCEAEKEPVLFCLSAESKQLWGARCASLKLSRLMESRFDLIVFPPSLVWTLATTHDDLNGPYFSRRDWLDMDHDT